MTKNKLEGSCFICRPKRSFEVQLEFGACSSQSKNLLRGLEGVTGLPQNMEVKGLAQASTSS